jgi:hypothetical protein
MPPRIPQTPGRVLGVCAAVALMLLAAGGCRSVPATDDPRAMPEAPVPASRASVLGSSTVASAATSAPASASATVRAVEPWRSTTREGERIITNHFRIHTTMRSEEFKRLMAIFSERAMAHWTTALAPLPVPDRQLDTFVFGSRDEWAAHTRMKLGTEAGAYLALGRGGYTSNAEAILYDIGPGDTLTILAHEGWHQFTQSLFKQELPAWLEEGIAAYMEGHRISPESGEPVFTPWRNFERFGELRDAVRRGRMVPVDQILNSTAQEYLADGRERLLTYYAQVWALVHYLREGEDGAYSTGLSRLLSDCVSGRTVESLRKAPMTPDEARALERTLRRGTRMVPGDYWIRAYFTPDLERFASGYRSFIDDIVARGSGDAIWRGRSPVLARRAAGAQPSAGAGANAAASDAAAAAAVAPPVPAPPPPDQSPRR